MVWAGWGKDICFKFFPIHYYWLCNQKEIDPAWYASIPYYFIVPSKIWIISSDINQVEVINHFIERISFGVYLMDPPFSFLKSPNQVEISYYNPGFSLQQGI